MKIVIVKPITENVGHSINRFFIINFFNSRPQLYSLLYVIAWKYNKEHKIT